MTFLGFSHTNLSRKRECVPREKGRGRDWDAYEELTGVETLRGGNVNGEASVNGNISIDDINIK